MTETARRWTIRRIMLVIALLAPFLALSRYPFVLGMVVTPGLIALLVAWCIRRRRYDRIAGLIIGYPAVPLFIMYLHRALIYRRLVRRSSPFFAGLIGLSDIGGLLCLFLYVGCVSLAVGAAASRMREAVALRRAAWLVVILLPFSWVALFSFAIWDPFGVVGYFFH